MLTVKNLSANPREDMISVNHIPFINNHSTMMVIFVSLNDKIYNPSSRNPLIVLNHDCIIGDTLSIRITDDDYEIVRSSQKGETTIIASEDPVEFGQYSIHREPTNKLYISHNQIPRYLLTPGSDPTIFVSLGLIIQLAVSRGKCVIYQRRTAISTIECGVPINLAVDPYVPSSLENEYINLAPLS